ncbi:TPA: transcriptional regulator [Candidatus Latescibacteria bacterium]|nr:transcriptional regulator [Candidatus Latescibacterota bacterium]|tara:strand:+ start:1127 stop:1480 length:354 start_codon:yes stop_codon:yes gene_type:complete
MNIKPIKTKSDHRAALKEIDRLWEARKGSANGDRLDVLVTLVEAWEDKHQPIDPPDPIEAILFRMEKEGLTRKDLEPYIGPRQRVSDILTRKRSLSLKMIRKLHEGLGIAAEVLIRE